MTRLAMSASIRYTADCSRRDGLPPRIYDKELDPRDWLGSYYQTYIESDVRDIINIGDLDSFQRFVRLCSGRSGQLFNPSSLGVDAGITHPTVRKWISVLQAGFLFHLLPPHHLNFSKRLVKTPKLFSWIQVCFAIYSVSVMPICYRRIP